MTVYGYIRVSTDKQTVENQRYEINEFCSKQNISVDEWIDETISGTKAVEKRRLGRLLKKLKKDDIMICSELSRLGRSLFMIKVLAFAFGLSAEIERNLISQRTREALARVRAEGKRLGRPKGAKSSYYKLSGHESEILRMMKKHVPKIQIARKLHVHRNTLNRFIVSVLLKSSQNMHHLQ